MQQIAYKIKSAALKTATGTNISWDEFILKRTIRETDTGKAVRGEATVTADGGSVLLDIPEDKNSSITLDFIFPQHKEEDFENTVISPTRDGATLRITLQHPDDANKIMIQDYEGVRIEKINQQYSYENQQGNPHKLLYTKKIITMS